MKFNYSTFELKTTNSTDILDITGKVEEIVSDAKVRDGLVTLIVPGSTAGITTIEYEEGVVEDLRRTIDEIVPKNRVYLHDSRWGDGNGYSHVRAALLKPSLTIPVKDGNLILGTWQQVVLLDFDNRPRTRKVVVQIISD